MSTRLVLVILFFAAALIYFGYWLPKHEGIPPGELAPDFELLSQNDQSVSLSALRGKTILLNFWATWCPPCVREMPSLESLSQQLSGEGLQVLAVSVDEEGWPAVRDFLARIPLSFPVLLDQSYEVADLYGTYQLPESYLIGPKGLVIKRYLGPREWDAHQMISEIREIMAEEMGRL